MISYLTRNAGKLFLLMLISPLFITAIWGIKAALCYFLFLLFVFVIFLIYRAYPNPKKRVFYNRTGKFEVFDIVYDRGSATRPNMPGFLKHDGESWFLIYEDGFEWPLSDFRNIEMFIYQPNN